MGSMMNEKSLRDELEKLRLAADKAGLKLHLTYTIEDVRRERLQLELQRRLAGASAELVLAQKAAEELGQESFEFMGMTAKWSHDGLPAHGGLKLFENWRGSSFDCYPTNEAWEWLYGPNPPPKPYDR